MSRKPKPTPELSDLPQCSWKKPPLCTLINSPLSQKCYHPLLPPSLSLLFFPLLSLLLFPASWLSFGNAGWMTDEMEETGYGDIAERKNGPLLTLLPSLHSKSISISNESGLCAILEHLPNSHHLYKTDISLQMCH